TQQVCADACVQSEPHFELDLSEPRIYRENENVDAKVWQTSAGRCREPALLKIPLDKIGSYGLIKLDVEFGPVLHNFSIDIGTNYNQTNNDEHDELSNLNIFNQEISIVHRPHSCLKSLKPSINQRSVTLIEPGARVTMFISNMWLKIENLYRTQQTMTLKLNETGFLFNNNQTLEINSSNDDACGKQNEPSNFLYIGLNRNIDGNLGGIGLCSMNLTFIECETDNEPALEVDVSKKSYKLRDHDNINWISQLSYLDPHAEIKECIAQGVVRLTFDPKGVRKIARFDLTYGPHVQGFTFNIGDSSTNNAYGGDGGTTSNSAEIHSNDNRFYIWANTKICGDTLLLKIDYNVIEPYDNITIFVSNERVELTNHRSYHEVFKSPYLYALAGQNVTCNCFDTLCYPGVQPDNDVWFGINRVIGGTYRPGVGVCSTKVNWIQCKKFDISPRKKFDDVIIPTKSTSTTTIIMTEKSTNVLTDTSPGLTHSPPLINNYTNALLIQDQSTTSSVPYSSSSSISKIDEKTSTIAELSVIQDIENVLMEETTYSQILNQEENSISSSETHSVSNTNRPSTFSFMGLLSNVFENTTMIENIDIATTHLSVESTPRQSDEEFYVNADDSDEIGDDVTLSNLILNITTTTESSSTINSLFQNLTINHIKNSNETIDINRNSSEEMKESKHTTLSTQEHFVTTVETDDEIFPEYALNSSAGEIILDTLTNSNNITSTTTSMILKTLILTTMNNTPILTTSENYTNSAISNTTEMDKNNSSTISSLATSNPCTLENLQANFVYHEYPLDKHKFIFCDNYGQMNVISCSKEYLWVQSKQSCIKQN
ncbi:unnamed protein product, partial [Didymodactylos carnosus]